MPVWDPDDYATHARFVSDLGAPLVDLLDPRPGERVLDLGCGDGALTERIAALGCEVVGIDSSPEQVWAALARGLDARIGDAARLEVDGPFDAVFSNAVLHWIPQPDPVIDNVRRVLRSGGRFVAEFGGHGCVRSIRESFDRALAERGVSAAAVDPWYFPTADEYEARLTARGFGIDSIACFPRPTPLRSDIDDWLRIFAQPFLDAVPRSERPGLVRDVRARLEPRLRTADGVWVVDYVRLRVVAIRTG